MRARAMLVAAALSLVVGASARAEPAPAEAKAAPAAMPALAAVEPSPAPTPPPAPPAAPDAQAQSKAPVVSDGPVAVTTRLSPDPSNVGDLLVFEVVAAYPRDVRVNLPTKLSFDPLHHVGTEEGEPEPTGDGLRKTFRIELQHFTAGPAKIPSFPLTYVDADGKVHTVQIPARTFAVESLLVNEDDPQRRGEDPPISREYPDTLTETIVWSALATLLLGLVLWLAWRRIFGRERQEVLPPPIPPHELAFEALDELERGELLAQGEVQRYYVELTEIAKGYLEGRFGVLALDRTTDEIRTALLRESDRIAPLSADEVMAFLQRCDLVKFARWQPPEEESREALTEVRQMVHSSLRPEGPAGQDQAAADGEGEPAGVAEAQSAEDQSAAAKTEAHEGELATEAGSDDAPAEYEPQSSVSDSRGAP